MEGKTLGDIFTNEIDQARIATYSTFSSYFYWLLSSESHLSQQLVEHSKGCNNCTRFFDYYWGKKKHKYTMAPYWPACSIGIRMIKAFFYKKYPNVEHKIGGKHAALHNANNI